MLRHEPIPFKLTSIHVISSRAWLLLKKANQMPTLIMCWAIASVLSWLSETENTETSGPKWAASLWSKAGGSDSISGVNLGQSSCGSRSQHVSYPNLNQLFPMSNCFEFWKIRPTEGIYQFHPSGHYRTELMYFGPFGLIFESLHWKFQIENLT